MHAQLLKIEGVASNTQFLTQMEFLDHLILHQL